MAAVTRVKARPVTPVGYEVSDKCVLANDVDSGDLLSYTGVTTNGMPVMDKTPITGIKEADGISLMKGYAGDEGHSVGIHGEMDGFSGMTPGAALYPSTATAGGLDTTAISGATPRIKAVKTTRIRFNFV